MAMYSEHALDYAEVTKDNIYNAHYERPSLLSGLPDVTNKKVLDLACGAGHLSKLLLEMGAAEVTAVDLSEEMVEIARGALAGEGERARVYVQDMAKEFKEEKDGVYDVVVCSLAVHYVKDHTQLFKEVARVLNPKGGRFVFSTHHPLPYFRKSPSDDYFQTEWVTEKWNTIPGKLVEVSYYRTPLSALFSALKEARLATLDLFEGAPDLVIKERDPGTYEKLSKRPCFIFFVCGAY